MQTSLIIIQNELEKARERLKGVEENIKKSIGRDIASGPPLLRPGFKRTARQLENTNDTPIRQRFSNEGVKSRLGEFVREPVPDFRGRVTRRTNNNEPPARLRKVEKPEERISAKKRLGDQPAVTVFSRLSGPPKDEEFEEKESTIKITSQVIVQDAPSRKEVLAAQNGDNQSKARNKRMFGALLGTLQKFRQEENRLKEKEEKRAQVEKKLEEAALREKEELKKKRQELFTSRRQQQIEIKQLEYKLLRLKQLTEWESTKKHLLHFIQTKTSPKIFYLPKTHNEKTTQLLAESRKSIQRMIEEKRAEVEKAIADHANKKESKEDNMDEDPEQRIVEMDGEEEDGELREEDSSKEVNESDLSTIKIKQEVNGVSDKENDVEEDRSADEDNEKTMDEDKTISENDMDIPVPEDSPPVIPKVEKDDAT